MCAHLHLLGCSGQKADKWTAVTPKRTGAAPPTNRPRSLSPMARNPTNGRAGMFSPPWNRPGIAARPIFRETRVEVTPKRKGQTNAHPDGHFLLRPETRQMYGPACSRRHGIGRASRPERYIEKLGWKLLLKGKLRPMITQRATFCYGQKPDQWTGQHVLAAMGLSIYCGLV